ncbi:MAG: S9 family peptidase [Bacteroidota bacterium]
MNQSTMTSPPEAEKIPKELSIHGDTRIDNYYWMNDREDPKVISYLNAENDYTTQSLQHTEPLQKQLYDEIIARIKQDDISVPYKDNGYYYLTRYESSKEYPIYVRKKGSLDAEEEITLDVNQLAEGFDYFAAVGLSVSPNNQLLAYGEDTLSRRIYTVRVKNMVDGQLLEDAIPNTTGRVIWANDNKTFFYTVKDKTLRAYKIFKHRLGTPASEDVEIFHESDETFSCYVYKSRSDKYIIIGSYQTLSNEFRFIDADTPDAEFRVFQPRQRNLEYNIEHDGDKFYVRTNLDARNFRLMETPVNATSKDNWKEVIPHREDVLLGDVDAFKDFMALSERKNGITQLRIRHKNGDDHSVAFKEDAYLAYVSTNREFDTELLRVGYQSMTTPNSIYDYDISKRSLQLLKQQEVIGDFDPENYVSERVYAEARDGVKVPISLVYRKGFEKNASAPLLLYGYGSYGNSMEPYFSSVRLSLLDRGFVYAIAHIRGGEEMGRHWYEDGKLLKKKNTFTDFIDCGDYLVKEKYANKEQVYAMGGSAGGLLMGAIINMRPEMFRGVVAAVPFVDVITTMLDESIPLTTGEFDEWGNPKDKEYYDYIKSYSPYDNVVAKDYPNMLVTTGLHDSQVQYWEPAKWVAKLREFKTDDNKLLLHTNMKAGHSGASGRFRRYKETALQYAFFLDLAGKDETTMKN